MNHTSSALFDTDNYSPIPLVPGIIIMQTTHLKLPFLTHKLMVKATKDK